MNRLFRLLASGGFTVVMVLLALGAAIDGYSNYGGLLNMVLVTATWSIFLAAAALGAGAFLNNLDDEG